MEPHVSMMAQKMTDKLFQKASHDPPCSSKLSASLCALGRMVLSAGPAVVPTLTSVSQLTHSCGS